MERQAPPQVKPTTALDFACELIASRFPAITFPSVRGPESTFNVAMSYALAQFAQTLRSQKSATPEPDQNSEQIDEESITSSLIGYLSTTLSWIGLMELMSYGCTSLPTMCWGYQDKKAETVSGGDFGLAIELPGGAGRFAVALFQAKNLEPDGRLNLNRVTRAYRDEASKRELADIQLRLILSGAMEEAYLPYGHQLSKLAISQSRGNTKTGCEDTSWVHYACWGTAADSNYPAHAIPITAVLTEMSSGDVQFMPSGWSRAMLKLSELSDVQTFEALLRYSSIVNGRGWLHVDREDISDFIGDLLPLGASWHVIGGGAADLLLQKRLQHFCVSHHQMLAHGASGPRSLDIMAPSNLNAYSAPMP